MVLFEPKTRKGEIASLILGIVGMAGILVIGAVAPNLVQLLPTGQRKFSQKSLYKSVEKLKNRGLLKKVKSQNGWRLELTRAGEKELWSIETKKKLLKKPWRWDKKWRILIFDIPEKKKKIRYQVRLTLINLGFRRLQDSVWIYPYECEDILELLRTKYGVRHEALYLRADKLSKDNRWREFFQLN